MPIVNGIVNADNNPSSILLRLAAGEWYFAGMTPEQFQQFCDLLSEGNPPTVAATMLDLKYAHVRAEMRANPEWQAQYDLAIQDMAETIAADNLTLHNNIHNPMVLNGVLKARQWYAAAQYPDKFAPRRNVNHKHTLDGDSLADAISKANARLLPVSYQPRELESQVIDVTPQSTDAAFDSQSKEPDLADVEQVDFSAEKLFE